ncbi:hypothetical protein QOK74_08075 [Staphylococcus saprophyticus]|uniref:hypothetical protein n=1 Tax=Staphylococcus saprophyticus TaxID=29385 RepID=UPI0024C38373|nr:hypothetical protein [Staphylococcus saprophyticus]MDK1672827.1 hypothetical protein [Staphylococcus saprophyticus]
MNSTFLIFATVSNGGFDWSTALPITAVATFLSTITTILYTNKRHKQDMLDKLDSKSGWRKELFELSFKSQYTIDDAYKLLSFIRFQPHVKPKTNFDNGTKLIYDVTNKIIELSNATKPDIENKIYEIKKRDNNIENLSDEKDKSIAKIIDYGIMDAFIKYLLAHQWEYLQLTPSEKREAKHFPELSKYAQKENELYIYLYKAVLNTQNRFYINILENSATLKNRYNCIISKCNN